MTPGWVQVECPICHVQQPAPLSLELGEVDYDKNELPVQVKADLRSVNAHVETCKRRHGQ